MKAEQIEPLSNKADLHRLASSRLLDDAGLANQSNLAKSSSAKDETVASIYRPVKEVAAFVAEHPIATGLGISAVVGLAFLSRGRTSASTSTFEKTALESLELPKLVASSENRIARLNFRLKTEQ